MQPPVTSPGLQGLQADVYQLVLAAVYHADGLWGEATFDLYARELPKDHGYLVVAGIEEALDAALGLRFSEAAIEWLRTQDFFSNASTSWWESLRHLSFQGDIYAVPEGEIVFPGEPILRVRAPLIQATLLETQLIQAVSHATAVASRASRLVSAAAGRHVFDFGSRRLPGPEATLLAARAAAIGGCKGTTYALAGQRFGLEVMGTLSASFLAAYGTDEAALDAFRTHFPHIGYVELPDGDILDGVRRLEPFRDSVRIVRVDHWNLNGAARMVRDALDKAGMNRVKILGSGSLDEYRIRDLHNNEAPIDMLAVGRRLAVGGGDPGMSMAYRIAEFGRGVGAELVTRPGASSYPGLKQVVRGTQRDMICFEDEAELVELEIDGCALLKPVVEGGERVGPRGSVKDAVARREASLAAMPESICRLTQPEPWLVSVTDRLAEASLG
jgi:nicotinate phosphoribosyltransferase